MWKMTFPVVCMFVCICDEVSAQTGDRVRPEAYSDGIRRLLEQGQRLTSASPAEADLIRKNAEKIKSELDSLNLQRAAEVNATNAELSRRKAFLTAQTDFMRDVSSVRKRDDLDKWVDRKRREWDADSGDRIGVVNPYNATEYYRYYDKDGSLAVSKVRGGYEELEQQRKDWEQSRQRAKWALESVNDDLSAVEEQFWRVMAIKAGASGGRRPTAVESKEVVKSIAPAVSVVGAWFQPEYNNTMTVNADGTYGFSTSTKVFKWKAIGEKMYDVDTKTGEIDTRAYYTVEGGKLVIYNAVSGRSVVTGQRK